MKKILYILIILFVGCGQYNKKETCDIQPIGSSNGLAEKYGYVSYSDIDLARQCSEQTHRPILIMFTASRCLSDRELPWKILEEKDVKYLINNHYIFTILYLDDKTPLERIDTTKKSWIGKTIRTIGQKNANFQIEIFKNNSQPYYAIVDYKLRKLANPIAYTPTKDKQVFIDFLKKGLGNIEQ